MAQYLRRFSERYLRPAALLWACVAGLCFGEAAFSLTRAEMTAAFQNAMRTVLIRVTGQRSADEDPALGPLLTNARRYVQQYRAAPDSQLWVAFDGPAIERWLTQNGQPLWGHERPMTLVLLAVQTGARDCNRRQFRVEGRNRRRGGRARTTAGLAERRGPAEVSYRFCHGE